MTFASPYYLWYLLAILPALILFFWWSWRSRQKLATQFIQARLLPGLVSGVSVTRQKVRAACLIVAVASLLVALARPQWNYDLAEVHQRGRDIIMAIDTSKSMLATDITPNRLARAKLAALDLMQQAKFDRLGLVAFSGTAFLQCPLTTDDAVFRQSVEALDTSTLPVGGTALAGAIETALKAFKEEDNHKVLVLFTDGEDHDSGALEAARKAARAGMRIFTVGIGSAEGEILRIPSANGQTNYIRDENGNVVKSHLNEGLLQQIASATPGGYYLQLRGANTVDVLYQQHLALLPRSESKEAWSKRPREQYHWPLALAIVLLLIEVFVPERKPEPKKAAATPAKAALAPATLAVLLLLPLTALGSSSRALREYQSGNYNQSLKEYEQLLQRKSEDPRLHFNAGTAAYRERQFDRAAKHFNDARTSPDLKMQEQAYYNLGNTLYQLGEQNSDPSKRTDLWQRSLTNFTSSLALNPQDADAKFNYEFVNRKLEELKKQQQQQQQQQQQNPKEGGDQKNQGQQDQKNQNDQSGKDQQPKPDSQDQKQNQQQPQPNQPQKDQPPKNQDQTKNSGQPEPDQNPAEEPVPYAVGQMTPQEAQKLLDAQKNDEMLLPAQPDEKAPQRTGPVRDW